MAEQRKRIGAVLLKLGGKTPADWTVEVFDSREWPEEPEAGAGLYRVRVAGKWLSEGGRMTFFNAVGLAALLTRELTTPGALLDMEAGRPDLRKGQPVRWVPYDLDKPSTRCFAACDPFQGLDGQWRIIVSGQVVPCTEVRALDRFGRELQPSTAKAG